MTKDLPIDERTKEMLDREFLPPPTMRDIYNAYAKAMKASGVGDEPRHLVPLAIKDVVTDNGVTKGTIVWK